MCIFLGIQYKKLPLSLCAFGEMIFIPVIIYCAFLSFVTHPTTAKNSGQQYFYYCKILRIAGELQTQHSNRSYKLRTAIGGRLLDCAFVLYKFIPDDILDRKSVV